MKRKVTYGFVSQYFDDDGNCVGQNFTAGDQVEWEDEHGNPIEPEDDFYHTFDMVHPTAMTVALVGNLSEGYGAVGPFLDFDSACDWADGKESWILTMVSPYDECSESFAERSSSKQAVDDEIQEFLLDYASANPEQMAEVAKKWRARWRKEERVQIISKWQKLRQKLRRKQKG